MKIINHTKYKTKSIRQVLLWCLKRRGVIGKNLTVEVGTSHRYSKTFVGGYAYYGKGDFSNRNYIMLKFPKEIAITRNVMSTFIHELAHTRGVKHKDLQVPEIKDEEYMDVLPLAIPRREDKPKKDLKEIRYGNALAKLAEYKSKLKRTEKLFKKRED